MRISTVIAVLRITLLTQSRSNHHKPPLMSFPPRKRRRGETKLTGEKLIDAVDTAISSLGSTELAVLQLFNHYDVDLSDLRCLLIGLYHSMNADGVDFE